MNARSNVVPTIPANSAKMNIPEIINTPPTIRPSPVTGAMSPKPTVVNVTKAHQYPSAMRSSPGLTRPSIKKSVVPPTKVPSPNSPNAKLNRSALSRKACMTLRSGALYKNRCDPRSSCSSLSARSPRSAGYTASTVKMSIRLKNCNA